MHVWLYQFDQYLVGILNCIGFTLAGSFIVSIVGSDMSYSGDCGDEWPRVRGTVEREYTHDGLRCPEADETVLKVHSGKVLLQKYGDLLDRTAKLSVRSPKRTDPMHKFIQHMIETVIQHIHLEDVFMVKTEQRIPTITSKNQNNVILWYTNEENRTS